jgi:nicotine blue oxidoreductase
MIRRRGACFNSGVRLIAIVLAAGEGRRMGGPKALLRIQGTSFLARVASLLQRPGVEAVVAVLGHEAARVRRDAPVDPSVRIVVNEGYEAGMLHSIVRGLEEAEALGADAALVHPVDHPLVEPATVDRVLAALRDGARIAVPLHQGRRGHPAGFARSVWPQVRAADPAVGARQVLHEHPDWVREVEGDPGAVDGIDTPEDYRRLVR